MTNGELTEPYIVSDKYLRTLEDNGVTYDLIGSATQHPDQKMWTLQFHVIAEKRGWLEGVIKMAEARKCA